MLKKIIIAALLIIPMGLFAQTPKFGHMASQEIIVLMPEYTKAQAEMQAYEKELTAELQRSADEVNKKLEEYQKAMAEGTLPQAIQERRQKEIQDLSEKAEQFQQQAYNDAQQKSAELMSPIYQKLESAIKSVGQEENFIYIFDLNRTSIPFVNESLSTDVTNKVKAKLGL